MAAITLPIYARPSAPAVAGAASVALQLLTPVLFRALCSVLVALFLALCCFPLAHGRARALLHPFAAHHVEEGLGWVASFQRRQRPWLTTAFSLSAHSVSVPFYGLGLPILLFAGLPELCMHLVFLLSLNLYVGNAIKDLACSPRPTSVPYAKAKLAFLGVGDEEARLNAKEYGLPSSHVMNTVCLQYYALHYLSTHSLISPAQAAVWFPLATLWALWIAASRLYLGLHTPVDLLGGALAGLSVTVCFIEALLPLGGHLVQAHGRPAAVALLGIACLVLLRLHPRPVVHTPSYEFTASFAGVAFGFAAGAARTWDDFHAPGILFRGGQAGGEGGGPETPWTLARRVLAGLVIVAVSKDVAKAALRKLLPPLYAVVPLSARRLWQPPLHDLPSEALRDAARARGGATRDADGARDDHGGDFGADGSDGGDADSGSGGARHLPERDSAGVRIASETALDAAAARLGDVGMSIDAAGADETALGASLAAVAGGRRRRPRRAASTLPSVDRLDEVTESARRERIPAGLAGSTQRAPVDLPRDASGRHWDLEITIRFFAYASIGFSAIELAPRTLRALGWY